MYSIPSGYAIEANAEDIDVQTPFARYAVKHTFDEGGLRYKRILEFTERIIPPELYPEYRAFMAQVARGDRAQVVLVKE